MAEATSTVARTENPQESADTVFAARFWARVDRTAGPDGCWPWTGCAKQSGHGQVKSQHNKNELAHRVAYRLTFGHIEEGVVIRHKKCNNPACCNPAHLRPGTHADNVADRVESGRSARGESHGRSKLSGLKVAAAKVLAGEGWSYVVIGQMFEVDPTTVGQAVRGKVWREATANEPTERNAQAPRPPHESLHLAGFEPATFGSVDR